jgi:hypothetical protein
MRAVLPWNRGGDGVRRQASIRSTERRDPWRANPRHVDEMERGEAGVCRHLSPVRNAPEVRGMAQRYNAGTVPLRSLDADRHSLAADDLSKAVVAVNDDQRPSVERDGRVLVRHDPTVCEVLDVPRQANDAMTVVSSEIGIHQSPRDQSRLCLLASGGRADSRNDVAECLCLDSLLSVAHASASRPDVPPRTMRFSATATRITAPVATPSQYCFTPIRIRPLVIIEMISTPIRLPKIVPRPP